MNNSPAHLVARALRDRRTVTWSQSIYHGGGGSWRFHSMTRSQILKNVRDSTAQEYNCGLEYDASRPPSTNGRYGLQAYAIIPKPPEPAPRDHAAERTALRVQRIKADIDALPEAELLHIVTYINQKTAQ